MIYTVFTCALTTVLMTWEKITYKWQRKCKEESDNENWLYHDLLKGCVLSARLRDSTIVGR